MPSELVHLAFAGLLAAALLGPKFDARSLAVVLAFAAVPDLDTFLGLWIQGGHRAILHTLLLPVLLAALIVADVRREDSLLRDRYGTRGVRVASAGVVALLFAGIAPDLFTNGVNVLYPVHDQFYRLSGEALLSNQRGLVQTFVEVNPDTPKPPGAGAAMGSTSEVQYSTGVDPNPASAGADGGGETAVERTFYLVQSGMELLIVLMGTVVTAGRLRESRR